MLNLKGECLCGIIKYQYIGELGDILHCHCSECRKWHGAAFRTRATARKENFSWLSGAEQLGEFSGLSNTIKTFCKICGSNLISYYKHNPELIGLPLGAIEGELGKKPLCHIFVDSKANWYEINDQLIQYNNLPEVMEDIHRLK